MPSVSSVRKKGAGRASDRLIRWKVFLVALVTLGVLAKNYIDPPTNLRADLLLSMEIINSENVSELEISKKLGGKTLLRISYRPSMNRFAYVWLLGGVHPDKHGYKGFMYTILISIHFLKSYGSQADFVVYVQLSPEHPNDTLGGDEAGYFDQLGARIFYLDKPQKESFHQIVYEKLRPLELTEYDRIQFLDGDLLPLRNMDYIFEESIGEKALLAPNVIHATGGEPCNAGWFMLEPTPGGIEQVKKIILAQHQQAKNLPYPKFDRSWGWGHNFRKHKDHWEGITKNGTKWNYHAAHSDQGLVYFWVKYHVQDVSIVIHDKIQRWGPGADQDHPVLVEQVHSSVLDARSPPKRGCRDRTLLLPTCPAIYRDFVHYFGSAKPWGKKVPRAGKGVKWFEGLKIINRDLSIGLHLDDGWDFEDFKEPPLGRMAMWGDHFLEVAAETNQTTAH